MYVSDDLVFLQLQKTACSHIESILKSCVPGETIGKHGPLTFNPGRRRIVGSIRNPFDWYVSLWSYGCQGQGAIRTTLTTGAARQTFRTLRERARHPTRWKEVPPILARTLSHVNEDFEALYTDSDDPELFRAWLQRLLQGPGRPYLEGDYPIQPVDERLGLLSYRFLQLFTDFQAWTKHRPALLNQADVRQFYHDHAICSTFIRNERLEQDLADLLCDLGYETSAQALRRDKVNASKHRPYTEYYNNETVALVRNRDGLICDLFSYELFSPEAQ